MNNILAISQIVLSSFIFGAVLCMAFVFRPTIEGLIAVESKEESIRALEKLKLDTWISYNYWAIVAVCGILATQLTQLFLGYPATVRIIVSCVLLGTLIWNQAIDKKLLNLTDTVPTVAIVTDRGDRNWEFYHDQAPLLGIFLMLLSFTLIVVEF